MMLMPSTDSISVTAHADRLEPSYDRFLIVSHRRHLDEAVAAAPGTLIYSTDWLTWRLCVDAGVDAVHFEGLLTDWPAERGDPHEAHRAASEWMYVDGRDVTLFESVSLGKLFIRNVSMFCNAVSRQQHALERACRRWQPRELILIDLRAEMDIIDSDSAIQLVASTAARHDVLFTNRPDRPEGGDPGFPEWSEGYGVPLHDPIHRRFLRGLFCETLDWLSRARDLFWRTTPAVLVLSNWSTVRGLLAACEPDAPVRLAVLNAHLPKRPALLWQWFRQGVIFVGQRPVRLTHAERAKVASIVSDLESAWRVISDEDQAILRGFVRQRVLQSGWLEAHAANVKIWRRTLRRHSPARVLIGDSTNLLCRILAEVAQTQSTAVDELLNGVFLTKQRSEARTGDDHRRPVVDRLLSWGIMNERWLQLNGASLEVVRTGYPALDGLRRSSQPDAGTRHRALVLPVYTDCDDTLGLWANIFTHLVTVVAGLQNFGCTDIRVKVHPGPFNARYYSDVLAHFGLTATVIKDGPLEPHMEWSDFVVGPVNSGAFVEALALGRPYYPMRCSPTLLDDKLLGPVRCYADGESLLDALRRGEAPDDRTAGEYMASLDSIRDAGQAVLNTWYSEFTPAIEG